MKSIEISFGDAARARGDESSCLDDAIECPTVDHQVLDEGEGFGAPRLDPQIGAVRERPHVQLTGRRGTLRPVRPPVDHHAARAADPFPTVVVERDGLFPPRDELLEGRRASRGTTYRGSRPSCRSART